MICSLVDHTEDVSHDIGVEDNSVKEDFPHLPSGILHVLSGRNNNYLFTSSS